MSAEEVETMCRKCLFQPLEVKDFEYCQRILEILPILFIKGVT